MSPNTVHLSPETALILYSICLPVPDSFFFFFPSSSFCSWSNGKSWRNQVESVIFHASFGLVVNMAFRFGVGMEGGEPILEIQAL